MRSFSVLLLLTGLLLVAVAAIAGSGLAVFTDSTAVTNNTFTTAACFGGDTGFLDPSADAADTGGDGDGFEANPAGAFSDGGGFAINNDGTGDRHRYYDYGISVGPACVISGIEVRLDWWLDSTVDTSSMSVELSWDGGASWTAAKTDTVESTSQHTTVLAGPTDTWGRTWTPAELSDATFRARLTSNSDNSSRDFFIDWVPVKVYYGP